MPISSKTKVYHEVLNKIRTFIEENQLSEGDRLPSERELAEQLNAARSSVREALRAIELLGLVETRHGEGTFLKTYRPYHTVELLATFVLRQSTTIKELFEVKFMLEKECLKKVYQQFSIIELKELLNDIQAIEEKQLHFYFFKRLFQKANNELFTKIWQLIDNFTYSSYKSKQTYSFYEKIIDNLEQRKIELLVTQLQKYYDEEIFDYGVDKL
ncbi:FadR/GntR family transcriptional regulator [Bacillaceae bacterium W0354]